MLRIQASTLADAGRYGTQAYPHECCGVLLGPPGAAPGSWRATRAHPTKNLDTARAKDRYLMDPADRLAAEEAARRDGLVVVGFYHSHPDHDVYFSRTDLERSEEYQWGEPWVPPSYAYLVLSVRAGEVKAWKAFKVDEGAALEVPVEIE
jgi:proteasome lid subunit RPN8/RPN11